jgi:hypothetical protein
MADCYNVLNRTNAGRLTDQELRQMLKDLEYEYKVRKASGDLGSLEKSMFEQGVVMIQGADLNRKIEKRNRVINIVRESRLLRQAELADEMVGDPSLGIEGALVGVNAPFEGASRSVDSLTNAIMNSYMGGMIADLRAAGLLKRYTTMRSDFEREVARVIADLNSPNPKGNVTDNAAARQIGEIMFKYQRASLVRENAAGSYIRLKEGRVVRASHDPSRMAKVGRDAWKDYIRDKLDYDRMDVRADRIEDFLDSAYEAITSGVRLDDAPMKSDIASAFKGPSNLAKKRSASGVFTFKDSDNWYDYDQKFGRGSLREAFQQDMGNSARSTALMEVMGTNPDAMLDRVLERLKEKHRNDPKKLARLKRETSVLTFKAALREVTGDINIGSTTPAARFFHAYRALQTMSKLGGAAISALSDVAFIASARIYQGRSLMDAWGDAFSAVFKGMNKGEMREFADRMAVGIESQLGEFMSRFNAADDVPGATSKLMQTFFKLNLLQPWTEANKRGVVMMIANDLGREAGKPFGELAEDMQRMLRIYGMSEADWNTARASVSKGPDGRDYIIPGEIEDARVRESMFALLVNEVDNAVPSPGARERAIMRRGYRPGTAAGEAIRMVTQFKSFGVTGLTRSAGRHVYGYGAKNMRDALINGKAGKVGLANAIIGTTFLGYFLMQAKEVMKGRDPREPSPEAFIAAAMQGGGLGIYGDFLFGEASRYGGGTIETLAGPGIVTFADTLDLLQRARGVVAGGEDDLGGDAIRLLKSNTPFGNLFYTKQAMDYMIWYQAQEMINPGYLRRMERRVKRENDQTFWLPPTSVVQTGGGFR